ncbi:MAG TPA: hypothetical protein VEG34_17315 [Thermoanaerobaculia bacterium]|nr:hypothetical protein [Thermoanaerobaculia bacterium]
MTIRRLRRTALVVLAAACLGLTPAAWAAPESRRGERPELPFAGLFHFVQQTWSLLPTLWDLLDPTAGAPSGGDDPSSETEGSGIDPDGGRRR